jgi:predicted nucleic acid-binding protein
VKVLLDLNVLLDVIQEREPHYTASAAVLDRIAAGEIEGAVPGHALTTVYYLVSRFADGERADQAVDWLLDLLEVVPESREVFLRARGLPIPELVDAVVAAAAAHAGCDRIVTRNVGDFGDIDPPAVTPVELEVELSPL